MKGLYCLRWTLLLCLTVWWGAGYGEVGSVEEILHKLACRSVDSKSDSVLVTRDGRVVFEYRSDPYWQPIDASSITKSITALAIGLLIDEGKIDSVDTPVYHFYPEWNQGLKRTITIRHLLLHTSGIQSEGHCDEVYRCGNIIQFVLCAELSSVPGCHFFYNNKAVNLLSGIVKRASGRSLSEYLSVKLFTPMGIQNVSWLSDPCGTDYAMSHLIITAPDLIKIGELLANNGFYCGQSLISASWIQQMLATAHCQDPFYGMLWWKDYYSVEYWWDETLLQEYQCKAVDPCYIRALQNFNGRVFTTLNSTAPPYSVNLFSQEVIDALGGPEHAECFALQVREQQVPLARWCAGTLKSFAARGHQGQQLIIFPASKIVGVRQMRVKCDEDGCVDSFNDFGALLEELVYRMGNSA